VYGNVDLAYFSYSVCEEIERDRQAGSSLHSCGHMRQRQREQPASYHMAVQQALPRCGMTAKPPAHSECPKRTLDCGTFSSLALKPLVIYCLHRMVENLMLFKVM